MASVELIDVTKCHGKQTVLQPLDPTIPDGNFIVLVGLSGYDKSTLLCLLVGLETFPGGTILMNRRPVSDLDPADHDMAMVFQSYMFYPHPTMVESPAFHTQARKVDKQLQKSKAQQAASLLGVDKLLARHPRAPSDSQRQRVAMGRAMIRSPQIFLLDEPSLDPGAQLWIELRAGIKSLHQRINTTMIYVTHDQTEAMILADQTAMMRDGQIVQQEASLTTYSQPRNTLIARLTDSPPTSLLPGQCAVRDGQPNVVYGVLWFPLAKHWHQAVAQQGDTLLIVGLCPQDILPGAYGAPATINIMEVTRESTLLHLDWRGLPVYVQVAGRVAVAVQQTLGLTLRHENLHLFDIASDE